MLQSYGVSVATADRFGGEFPVEEMGRHAITVVRSARTKSEIYRESLPRLNSGNVELLDLPRLHAQLAGLERRTARGGRDTIDHTLGAHDDMANAACGALVEVFLPASRAYGIGHAVTADRPIVALTVGDGERELARRRALRATVGVHDEVMPLRWVADEPVEDEPVRVLWDWDPWATEPLE